VRVTGHHQGWHSPYKKLLPSTVVYESLVGLSEECMFLFSRSSILLSAALVGSALSVGAALSFRPATAGYAGNLEVRVQGLKSANGQVCLTLFSGPKGFPKGGNGSNLKASRCTVLARTGNVVTFSNVPYGVYAVAAVHDSNSDNQLNKNGLGIPSEGFGFSNNPPLRFGPASFAESEFFVSGTKTIVQIKMQYIS
jgi:uncharacterized protein (DUF2141 family)